MIAASCGVSRQTTGASTADGEDLRRRSRSRHNGFVVYIDNILIETRYLVPPGADWAVWDDANGVLSFMTDAEAVENARENERELGDEFATSPLPPDPTPEQAWAYVNELWRGDPGGRGWQLRVPAGATWLSLRDDEEDGTAGEGPVPTFGFGKPPRGEGMWETPSY